MGVLTDQPSSFGALSQGTGVSGLLVPDWLLVLLVPVSSLGTGLCFLPYFVHQVFTAPYPGSLWIYLVFPFSCPTSQWGLGEGLVL